MLSSFASSTITRLRFPTMTERGVTVPDYDATPAREDIAGCVLEPIESQENNDGRAAVLSGWTVAAPEGVDIVSADLVEYAGDQYQVIGDVMRIPSPTGALAYTRLSLKRWEG